MSTSFKLAVAALLALASVPFAQSSAFAQLCANRGHASHAARTISYGDDYDDEDEDDYDDEEDYEDEYEDEEDFEDDYEDDDEDDYEDDYEDGEMEEYVADSFEDAMDESEDHAPVRRRNEDSDFFFGARRGHGHSQGRAATLPEWMVGKWLVRAAEPLPGAPKVEYVFGAEGTVRKVSTSITAPPVVQKSTPQQAVWRNGQLTVGSNVYRVATTGTRMTLTNREGRTMSLVRVQERGAGAMRVGSSRSGLSQP